MAEKGLTAEEKLVLRTATHHRKDFDYSVIHFDHSEHEHVLSSLTADFPTEPVSNLGSLDKLPYELKLAILSRVDVQSFFRLRHVNRKMRMITFQLDQYRDMVKHGLNAVLAVFKTGMASRLRLIDLYRALCMPFCYICGSFGGFLWIPTAQRCCFGCIESNGSMNDMRVLKQHDYDQGLWTWFERPGTVVTLHNVPATYSLDEEPYPRKMRLVCPPPAEKWGIGDDTTEWTDNLRHLAAVALPWYDIRNARVEVGLSCRRCDDRRDMRETPSGWLRLGWARMYTERECIEHLKQCDANRAPR